MAKKALSPDFIEVYSELAGIRDAVLKEARTRPAPKARSLRGEAGSMTRTLNNMHRYLTESGYDMTVLEVSA